MSHIDSWNAARQVMAGSKRRFMAGRDEK